MSVSSTTMKGKNDRMTLAATENAKVWTSVVVRYLAVGQRRPWNPRARERARLLVLSFVSDLVAGIGIIVTVETQNAHGGHRVSQRSSRAAAGAAAPHPSLAKSGVSEYDAVA